MVSTLSADNHKFSELMIVPGTYGFDLMVVRTYGFVLWKSELHTFSHIEAVSLFPLFLVTTPSQLPLRKLIPIVV